MRALRSIIRWFFGLQAGVLILSPVAGLFLGLLKRPHTGAAHLTAAHRAASPLASYGILAGVVLVGLVFAMAWWTTRRPSPTRSVWALAASLFYIAEGVAYFVYIHRLHHTSSSGLDLVAIGVVGLVVFSRCDDVPAVAKRAPIAGDRTSPLVFHAVTALSTVAQIAAIVFWGRWAYTHMLYRTRGLTWLVLITLSSILATFIHECGHAVIAWCFQMGLLSFKVGPLQWVRREGKWRFKFHLAGLLTPGGAVGAVPTLPNPPQWEEVLVIAAGPAANLLFGVATIYAVLHDRWASYQHTWEFIAFTGSFCVIAAVLNLFPFMSEDGAYSDGARILQIVTHSPLDDFHRAMASIASTTLTERRYRDLDVAQIERAAMLFPRELRGLHLLLCVCHFHEDAGRTVEASTALAAAEAIYNAHSIDLPGPLHTIFVIGHALLNRDAAAARLWWDRMDAKGSPRSNVDFWLAKTALLWIEGDLKGAEDAWQEANMEARGLPQFGAYEFDRYRCTLLRQTLDGSAQSPAPVAGRATAAVAPAKASPPPVPAASTSLDTADPFSRIAAQVRTTSPAVAVADPHVRIAASSTLIASPGVLPDSVARIARSVEAPTPIATMSSDRPLAVSAAKLFGSGPRSTDALSSTTNEQTAPRPVASYTRVLTASAAVLPVVPPVAVARIPASTTQATKVSLSGDSAPTVSAASFQASVPMSPGTLPAKGPSVPAAFARRPLRPVPPPPSDPYAEVAVLPYAEVANPEVELDLVAATVTASAPAEASLASHSAAKLPVVSAVEDVLPPPPVPADEKPRFDPFDVIRAAAIESLRT